MTFVARTLSHAVVGVLEQRRTPGRTGVVDQDVELGLALGDARPRALDPRVVDRSAGIDMAGAALATARPRSSSQTSALRDEMYARGPGADEPLGDHQADAPGRRR